MMARASSTKSATAAAALTTVSSRIPARSESSVNVLPASRPARNASRRSRYASRSAAAERSVPGVEAFEGIVVRAVSEVEVHTELDEAATDAFDRSPIRRPELRDIRGDSTRIEQVEDVDAGVQPHFAEREGSLEVEVEQRDIRLADRADRIDHQRLIDLCQPDRRARNLDGRRLRQSEVMLEVGRNGHAQRRLAGRRDLHEEWPLVRFRTASEREVRIVEIDRTGDVDVALPPARAAHHHPPVRHRLPDRQIYTVEVPILLRLIRPDDVEFAERGGILVVDRNPPTADHFGDRDWCIALPRHGDIGRPDHVAMSAVVIPG